MFFNRSSRMSAQSLTKKNRLVSPMTRGTSGAKLPASGMTRMTSGAKLPRSPMSDKRTLMSAKGN